MLSRDCPVDSITSQNPNVFSPAYLPVSPEQPGERRRDIKKTVLVPVFLVDAAHESGGGRQHFVDEDEDGLLWCKLDTLANDVAELADRQVRGHKILLLVYSRDIGLLYLLTDDLASVRHRLSREDRRLGLYRDPVRILLPDALSLGLSFLERVFILEFGAHLCVKHW